MISRNLCLACPLEFSPEIKNVCSIYSYEKNEGKKNEGRKNEGKKNERKKKEEKKKEKKKNKENKNIISIFTQEMIAKLNEPPKDFIVELLQDNLRKSSKSIKIIKKDGNGEMYYVFIEFLNINGILFRTVSSYDFKSSVNIKKKISFILKSNIKNITSYNSSEKIRGYIIMAIHSFVKIVSMGSLISV